MSTSHIEAGADAYRQMFQPQHASADDAASVAVDLAALHSLEEAQIKGEPDLIVELINLFIEDAPQKLNALRNGFDEGDGQAVRHAAHNLKGSSASMGALRMASVCGELEEACGREALEGVGVLLGLLSAEYGRVRRVLEEERRTRANTVCSDSLCLQWELCP
jgi:HPt (histidine-containing phosphotransfer) domain-containing protein